MKESAEHNQTITNNKGPQIWPGRSKLRKEKSPVSKFNSSTTDGDQEELRTCQTNDGAWRHGSLEEFQPRSGPGHYMTVQELGLLPDDVIGPSNQKDPLPQPKGNKKTVATVRAAQTAYQKTAPALYNAQ
jgi:hypothetical protein